MSRAAELRSMMEQRRAERREEALNVEDRVAAAKKRRMLQALKAKDEAQERDRQLFGGEAAEAQPAQPAAAPQLDTAQGGSDAAEVLEEKLEYTRPEGLTLAQQRERAVKRLLLQSGFFDEGNVPQVLAAETDYFLAEEAELCPADIADEKAALLDMGFAALLDLQKAIHMQAVGAAASASLLRDASGKQKSAEEVDRELIEHHKGVAEAEEQQAHAGEVDGADYTDTRQHEDAMSVAESLQRIDRIRERLSTLKKGAAPKAVEKPEEEGSSSGSDDEGLLNSWRMTGAKK